MRVLVATDGSEFSCEAARFFIKLTRGSRHEITILHVMPLMTVARDLGYVEIEEEIDGMQSLSRVRSIFSQVAIPADIKLVQGIPAESILQVADEGHFDLIVVGHRGDGRFNEKLLGSVSKRVVKEAKCAVLVGREKQTDNA